MPALLARLWSNPYLLLTLATLFWAGNAIASRLAVGQVSPLALTSLRWVGVCLLVVPFYARDLAAAAPVLMRRPWLVSLSAFFGLTAFAVLIYEAGRHTSALNIGLLQGALPALVFLGAWLIHRSPASALQIIGVAITMVGVAIISTGGSLRTLLTLELNRGDLMMLAAVVFYAGYTIAMRDRPAIPSTTFFLAMALIAAVTSLPLIPIEYALGALQWPTARGWLIVAYVAIFPSFFAQVFYIRGVELVGPGRSGVFYNLLPAFTAVLAVAGLGEPFGPAQALALALILGGIVLAERRPAGG